MKFTKYRIVRDNYAGYEVQKWRFWFPFWVECDYMNTHLSLERAKRYIEIHKGEVVYKE
jgi:hypothetical protein